MTRVALVYPPATDPRAPHLPLPALAGFLRANGVETELIDLDLESLCAVLEPASLADAGRRLRAAPHSSVDERLLELSEILPERIGDALATLRCRERFLDANARVDAQHVIYDALDVASAAAPRRLRYSIRPMGYDVHGVEIARLADLLEVTRDPAANLFHDAWTRVLHQRLERSRPDLVGISISAWLQWLPALMLARELKARGHFVVLGGTFMARLVDRIAKLPAFFDHFAHGVVAYEGETALLELLAQLAGARDFSKVPNYVWTERGSTRVNPTHLEDVSRLPTPDFTGLMLDRYLTPEPVLPFMFGKGCYYDLCKFCDSSFINRISPARYRARPMDRVFEDLLTLHRRHGARHFTLADEAASPRLLEKLADRLLRAGSDFAFEAYARFERGFTSELLEKLSRAGVRRFLFGLESSDQATLDHMRKGISFGEVEPQLDRCDAAGIHYHVFGLFGLPEQGKASIERTAAFFRSERFSRVGNGFDVQPMQINLEAPYARELEELGIQFDPALLAHEFAFTLGLAWTNTRGVSRAEIESAHRAFYDDLFDAPGPIGPLFLWPALEEWGVYYADAYADRPFPYDVTLPDPPRAEQVRLRFCRWVCRRPVGAGMRLSSRLGSTEIDGPLYGKLAAPDGLLVRDALESLGGDSPEARASLNLLLRTRILELSAAPR